MTDIIAHKKDLTMLKIAVVTILLCVLIDEASAASLDQAATAAPIEQAYTD